jgi:hypothetical protein
VHTMFESFLPSSPRPLPCLFFKWQFYFGIILFCSAGAWTWTQGLHLEPPHQPFFVKGFSR